jgi:hypothetical protein
MKCEMLKWIKHQHDRKDYGCYSKKHSSGRETPVFIGLGNLFCRLIQGDSGRRRLSPPASLLKTFLVQSSSIICSPFQNAIKKKRPTKERPAKERPILFFPY